MTVSPKTKIQDNLFIPNELKEVMMNHFEYNEPVPLMNGCFRVFEYDSMLMPNYFYYLTRTLSNYKALNNGFCIIKGNNIRKNLIFSSVFIKVGTFKTLRYFQFNKNSQFRMNIAKKNSQQLKLRIQRFRWPLDFDTKNLIKELNISYKVYYDDNDERYFYGLLITPVIENKFTKLILK